MTARRVDIASAEDLAEAMEIVEDAFMDDFLMDRLFPGLPRPVQTRRYKELEHANIASFYQDGGVMHVGRDESGKIVCFAAWGSPTVPRGMPRFEWANLRRTIRSVGKNAYNVFETLWTYDRCRPKEPHWYLHLLATDKSARGTGITSAVMRAGLSAVDSTHAPAYLEASGEHLVPLYEHYGFHRCGTLPTRRGSAPVPMYRPAVGKR